MDHDISGEESPGILSDDGQHESPSDGAADIEEGISTRGMPWLRVNGFPSFVNSFRVPGF